MEYSLTTVTRAVLHWDEIVQVVPESRQPTDLQMLRCDMQLAFAACRVPHIEADALRLALSDFPDRERLARYLAAYLLPVLNGGLCERLAA